MKNVFRKTTTSALAFAFAFLGIGFGLTTETNAQTQRRSVQTRVNDRQVERIIRSIETRGDAFRRSFDSAMDRSRLDGTDTEDSANEFIRAFEAATDDLRSRFNGRTAVASDVENVLNRAALVDRFMRTNLRQARVQGDWALLRSDLQRLARAYNVTFNLNGRILPTSVVAAQRAYRVNDSLVQYLLNFQIITASRLISTIDAQCQPTPRERAS